MDRGAWQATVHGVASVGHDLVTKPPPSPPYLNSRHGLGLGLGGADGEASVCDAEDPGLIPGLGRSPGEGNSNPLQYSCWRIPWTEEPGGLPPMGSQRVGHNGATSRQTVDTQDGRKGHPWGDDGHHWVCRDEEHKKFWTEWSRQKSQQEQNYWGMKQHDTIILTGAGVFEEMVGNKATGRQRGQNLKVLRVDWVWAFYLGTTGSPMPCPIIFLVSHLCDLPRPFGAFYIFFLSKECQEQHSTCRRCSADVW